MDSAEQIKRMQAEIARLQGLPQLELPCDVTVLIPCFNSCREGWLQRCLYALSPGLQSLPAIVHVADQESEDGTGQYVVGSTPWWSRRFVAFRYLGQTKNFGHKMRNICLIRKNLAISAKTKYALYVDADVKYPPGGLRAQYEAMEADPKLGMLGILYDRSVNHVKMGSAMIRTELLAQVDFKPDPCECDWVNKRVVEMGYEARHLPAYRAVHMSEEVGS